MEKILEHPKLPLRLRRSVDCRQGKIVAPFLEESRCFSNYLSFKEEDYQKFELQMSYVSLRYKRSERREK